MTFKAMDATSMLLALGLLLISAQLLGELARKFHQPAILGELLVGIILGPTLLGRIAPDIQAFIFPKQGPVPVFFSGFNIFSISMFLLVAGMEINLSSVIRLGKTALTVSAAGIIVPFAVGTLLAYFIPEFLGYHSGTVSPVIFAIFIGTALSISALPVIAKTLMDLGLYKGPVGTVTMAAAVVNDLIGWIIFAFILSTILPTNGLFSVPELIGLIAVFTIAMLTIGRKLIGYGLNFFTRHFSWPGGVISFILSVGLLAGAFTEWIGIHSLFGAFIAGVVIGDSKLMEHQAMQQDVRHTVDKFITTILATIVFASIGLKLDFWQHFDLALILSVIAIACIGKVFGCYWAAKSTGMPNKESMAVGLAMNSRGAMEIILALIALEYKIIKEPLFVALVAMAIFTSAISGPLIRRALR
jgi:Kef-type K+ transport system membrane component KefB